MKIVCLIKQVPRPDAIEFDPDTRTLRREGVPLILNPFDATAVAEAVALRESVGGEVIAMTMGPPQAEQALRTCLALGADRCILLSDRVFAVADTLGTSRTLALALQKEGGVDCVLAGHKTVDSETWQVPPEVASRLAWPHMTNVVELEPHRSGGILPTAAACETGQRRSVACLPVSNALGARASAASEPRERPAFAKAPARSRRSFSRGGNGASRRSGSRESV